MLSFLKKQFEKVQEKVVPETAIPVVKIQCIDFDNIQQEIEVKELDIGGSVIYLRCPVCFEDFQFPLANIKKEYLHNNHHAIKLVSGVLKPERIR